MSHPVLPISERDLFLVLLSLTRPNSSHMSHSHSSSISPQAQGAKLAADGRAKTAQLALLAKETEGLQARLAEATRRATVAESAQQEDKRRREYREAELAQLHASTDAKESLQATVAFETWRPKSCTR